MAFRRVRGRWRARRPWRWALAVFVLSLMITGFLAVRHVVSARNADEALLETRGQAVALNIESIVRDAGSQAAAVAALFRASEEVTEPEFNRFVEDIGLGEGMVGLGFVVIVAAGDLEAFEADLQKRSPGAFVFEMAENGPVPVAARPIYYPVKYFYSNRALPIWGYDAGTDEGFLAAIDRAIAGNESTASALLGFPGQSGVSGLVTFEPTFDGKGDLIGLVASAIDLTEVLGVAAPMGLGEEVDLHLHDVSTGSLPAIPDGAWTYSIAAEDRAWRLDVTPANPRSQLWAGLGIFGLGLISSVALALVVFGFGARVQHRREVEELKLLDRQKDDFLATVSHELRTPLTSIVGFADALRNANGHLSGAEKIEMIDFIADEAESMEGIVQDLLVVARLHQGGTVPISCRRIDDLAAEVTRIADQTAATRHHPTTISGTASATADAARLRQILRNLFDNAVRHGSPPIAVRIDDDGAWVRMTVQDSGRGVQPDQVPGLFDRYRSGPNPEGLPTSTGIGLWLSRELARLMGGELQFLGSGGGATFEISLPIAGGGACAAQPEALAV